MTTPKYQLETKSTPEQVTMRKRMEELFAARPMPDEHLLVSLGLYMRSSALVKILFMNELYELIRDVPGVIMEFGVWWGQNLVLLENLRAIHEPFDQTRRVIGFDTFSGYASHSDADAPSRQDGFTSFSEVVKPGGYSVSAGYRSYLEELLLLHEKLNVLGTVRKHEVVEGDVVQSVPRYLKEHPETVVALAYFDLALYLPTKTCLEAIRPHLVPGSVLVMDEFNFPEAPGETRAFREVFGSSGYSIRKSRYIRDKALVFIESRP